MLGLSNVVACSSCSWCWWTLVAIGARWAAGNALDGCDPYWQPIGIMPGLNASLRMKFQMAINHVNIYQTGTIPGFVSTFLVVLDLEDIFIQYKFCSSFWELTSKGQWPTSRSLEMALATRGDNDRTHGHAMVLRWKRTLPLTDWQHEQCHRKGTKREECIKKWERENFCWEKFPFMVEPCLVRLLYDSLYCPWCLRVECKCTNICRSWKPWWAIVHLVCGRFAYHIHPPKADFRVRPAFQGLLAELPRVYSHDHVAWWLAFIETTVFFGIHSHYFLRKLCVSSCCQRYQPG